MVRGNPSRIVNVIRFDNYLPPGLARSTPRGEVFRTREERAIWANDPLIPLNTTTDGVARAWARTKVIGQLAGKGDLNVLKHITTDHTARDMLRITQAHGREKVQYWGFSCVIFNYTYEGDNDVALLMLIHQIWVGSRRHFRSDVSGILFVSTAKIWRADPIVTGQG